MARQPDRERSRRAMNAAERQGVPMIAALYALLAVVATVINIGAQECAILVYSGPYALPLSMVFGTAVGLVAKYVLDKRYIFRFRARDAAHDGQTFLLYTLMGLATTVIFWAFEAGFDYLFGTRTMRYAGAALGLAIGYAIKYQLDKRFVFRNGAAWPYASRGPRDV